MKEACRIFLEGFGISENEYREIPLSDRVALITAFESSRKGNSACLLLTWYLWVLQIYRQEQLFYSEILILFVFCRNLPVQLRSILTLNWILTLQSFPPLFLHDIGSCDVADVSRLLRNIVSSHSQPRLNLLIISFTGWWPLPVTYHWRSKAFWLPVTCCLCIFPTLFWKYTAPVEATDSHILQ